MRLLINSVNRVSVEKKLGHDKYRHTDESTVGGGEQVKAAEETFYSSS
jgi:hypothetical protein